MKHKDQKDPILPEALHKLKEENPFVIPHNYFKTLPDEVMQKIRDEEATSKSLTHGWKSYLTSLLSPRPAWALAAVLVVMGVWIWWSQDAPSDTPAFVIQQDLTEEEVLAYVTDHIDEFEEMDFYSEEAAQQDLFNEYFNEEELDPVLDELIEEVDVEMLEKML